MTRVPFTCVLRAFTLKFAMQLSQVARATLIGWRAKTRHNKAVACMICTTCTWRFSPAHAALLSGWSVPTPSVPQPRPRWNPRTGTDALLARWRKSETLGANRAVRCSKPFRKPEVAHSHSANTTVDTTTLNESGFLCWSPSSSSSSSSSCPSCALPLFFCWLASFPLLFQASSFPILAPLTVSMAILLWCIVYVLCAPSPFLWCICLFLSGPLETPYRG